MSTSKSARRSRSGTSTSKKTSAPRKSKDTPNEGHVCSEPGCGKVCKTAAGLATHRRRMHPDGAADTPPRSGPPPKETPAAAVERLLATLDLKPRHAVLVASIRELASTLEVCEPTDKTKTAKELQAEIDRLLDGQSAEDDGPDWTEDDE